jgi:hypothetical protein
MRLLLHQHERALREWRVFDLITYRISAALTLVKCSRDDYVSLSIQIQIFNNIKFNPFFLSI